MSVKPKMKLVAVFQADREEYGKAMLLFGYLFCVVSASTVGRTSADTLFLSRFDNSFLSLMYLPQAVAMILSGIVYQRFVSRFKLDRLILALIPILASLALLSRVGVGWNAGWVFPAIYVGYDVFNFFMIVLFWQFATAVMDQRKAKRTIGIVGSGGIAGGIISGFGLKAVVPLLGTENLIYLYAALQLLAAAIVLATLRRFPLSNETGTPKAPPRNSRPSKRKSGLFRHVPHLKYVAILSAALVLSLTLIDYQFKVILRENLQNDALAGFMGSFYGFSGVVALLVQLFVSGWVITRFGVAAALLVFPVILFAGSLGILAMPLLAMAVAVKGSDKVVGDTVYSSVSQLIMFPVSPEWRGKAKSFLDGVVRNGAKGLAALCLLVATQFLAPSELSYLILAMLGIAVAAAFKVKKTYLATLLSTLTSGGHELQRAELDFMDPASRALLTDALLSPDKQQSLYAFRILRDVPGFDFTPHLGELLRHPAQAVCLETLALIEQTSPPGLEDTLVSMLASPIAPIKAKAILALASYAKVEYLDTLTSYLEKPNIEIQAAAIAGLVKYYGIEGMYRSVGKLKLFIDSDREENRMAVASLFGQIGVKSFYKPLIPLLRDNRSAVRAEALKSAATLRVPELIPDILTSLESFKTRRHAIDALVSYDETEILPLLKAAMDGSDLSLHLPAAFERIGSARAFEVLFSCYGSATFDLRDKILESLTRMRKPSGSASPAEVGKLVSDEITLYRQFAEHGAPVAAVPEFAGIAPIIEDIRYAIGRRVFLLLGLIEDAATMEAVFENWSEGDPRRQANAAEVIDQTLQGALRPQVLALMSAARGLEGIAPAGPERAALHLEWLQSHGDEWLGMVAGLFAQRSRGRPASADAGIADRLGVVNLLQKVMIFQGLTSKERYRLSMRLQPIEIREGDAIVREGEPGDCMYVLEEGRAGVYRNERSIGGLNGGDCFGEMALFGQGLRTATIRAETDCRLWKLDSAVFYDLLFNRTSMALEMLKLLSRRLRSLLETRTPEERAGARPELAAAAEGAQGHLKEMLGKSGHEEILRRILVLQKIEIFSHVSPEDFVWLAQSIEEESYRPGESICRAGDYGDTMFAIVEGRIRVHHGDKTIALLAEGEYFGEMAVIDSGPRSADCTAEDDAVLLRLRRDLVLSFCLQNGQVLKSILRVLAERLRAMQ